MNKILLPFLSTFKMGIPWQPHLRFGRIALFIVSTFAITNVCAADHVPGDLLVQFKKNIPSVAGILDSARLSQNGLTVNRVVSASWNIWLLQTTPGNEDKAISFLANQPEVQTVQLNHYVTRRNDTIPNDPLFGSQWNLLNTGQSINGKECIAGYDINATRAWTFSTGGYTALGDTIVIAVIDGGADLNHPDIHFWKNTREICHNGIDDDHNGYIDDCDGWCAFYHTDQIPVDDHGTHVCGIAGAIGNNDLGICGVNWTTLIMPLALINYTEDEIVEDYTYVFNQRRDYNQTNGNKGAFVVTTNSSFGIDYGQPSEYPLWCAMYDSMGSVGILSAAATTNNDVNVDQVGDMPTTCGSNYLVTVTDMMCNGLRNPSAGFGPVSIDMEAPGTNITSTLPGASYGLMSGTSMASPHVAGAIALMYAAGCSNFMEASRKHPDSVALIVKQLLLDGVDTTYDMKGASVSGGRLDMYNSIQLLLNDFCDSCMVLSVNTQPVNCYLDKNGSASVLINNGVPPFKILWTTSDTTAQISGLGAGKYGVQVTDSLNCTKSYSFNLTQPDSLIAGYTIVADTDSVGFSNILTQVQGGVPPYIFNWSNGDTSQNIHVVAGTYNVTVTDANHCFRLDTVTVNATGIAQLSLDEQVKVFPNPTTGDVQLQLPGAFNNSLVQLIDMPGQVLWSRKLNAGTFVIPVSLFENGIYILKATIGNQQVEKKIVRL